jgi:hypothetical protein
MVAESPATLRELRYRYSKVHGQDKQIVETAFFIKVEFLQLEGNGKRRGANHRPEDKSGNR